MTYRPRHVDAQLNRALAAAGAVLIEGPKAVGKTATARQVTKSEVLLDVDGQARALAQLDPALLLEGEVPRLIDEWHLVDGIWDHVRRAVDRRRATDPASGVGQFVLAGSAVPKDRITRHVGSGRFIRLRMRPMTLDEAGHSSRAVSFRELVGGDIVRAPDPGLNFRGLLELLCIGGWPGNLEATADEAQRLLRGYVADVTRVDVRRLDDVRRSPSIVGRLLRSLARNNATAVPIATLRRDVNGEEGNHKDETISEYLDALVRLMIIEDLQPWSPSLRSRTRLRLTPVRHFVDPSLAIAAMKANPGRLLRDLEWTGLLFESLVVRDLRVYADALEAEAYSYRDESGLEADLVLELAGGGWAAFEVKLGLNQVDAAAANLLKLKNRVDARAAGEAIALVVVTGSGFAYRRDDGVSVVPIATLTI